LFASPLDPLDGAMGIAGQVTDDRVELSERNVHARVHEPVSRAFR